MKKIAKVLMTCVIAAVFMVITFSPATADMRAPAATQMQSPATTAILPTFMCPPGWHQKKKTSEEFKCAPNKVAPVKCPEGWRYVEAYDCQSYSGFGTQTTCSGCEVGCLKIPVIK